MLLLSSEMINNLTRTWINLTFCEWIVVLGFVLMPFTFFGSPAEFWPIAVFAMLGTAISSALIIGLDISDFPNQTPIYHSPTWNSFFTGIGTIMFSVAGAAALPTFQNDMKNKGHFTYAAILGFSLTTLMYITVALTSYLTYGHLVQTNIIRNLPSNGVTVAINFFMTCHVLCAYLIILNPVNLSMEDYCNIPHCKFHKLVIIT